MFILCGKLHGYVQEKRLIRFVLEAGKSTELVSPKYTLLSSQVSSKTALDSIAFSFFYGWKLKNHNKGIVYELG